MKKVIFPEIEKNTIRYQDLNDEMVIGIKIHSENYDSRYGVVKINKTLHTMMVTSSENSNSMYIDPFNHEGEIEKNPYKSIHDLIDRISEFDEHRNTDFFVFESIHDLLNWIASSRKIFTDLT